MVYNTQQCHGTCLHEQCIPYLLSLSSEESSCVLQLGRKEWRTMTEKEEKEDNHGERDKREEPSEERKQFHMFVGICTFCRISSVISAGTGYMGKDDMIKNEYSIVSIKGLTSVSIVSTAGCGPPSTWVYNKHTIATFNNLLSSTPLSNQR